MALYQAGPSSAGSSPLSRRKNAYKKARRFLRKHSQAIWAVAFIALAAGFYVWAAWLTYDFATYILQPAGGLVWQHAAGHAAALAFAFAAARHFLRIGLRALPFATDPASSAVRLTDSLPSALTWTMVSAVTVPVTVAVAFAENPGLAVVYLASLVGVAAMLLSAQAVQKCAPPSIPHHPASGPCLQQAAADADSQRAYPATASNTQNGPAARARTALPCAAPTPPPSRLPHGHGRSIAPAGTDGNWLECLRRARVSMDAVKSLYQAGYRSLDDLRHAEDRSLLAIRGIGPATLRKIRRQLKGAGVVAKNP